MNPTYHRAGLFTTRAVHISRNPKTQFACSGHTNPIRLLLFFPSVVHRYATG